MIWDRLLSEVRFGGGRGGGGGGEGGCVSVGV